MTHKHKTPAAERLPAGPAQGGGLSTRRTTLSMMLEPRILLDAAGAATAVQEAEADTGVSMADGPVADALLASLAQLQSPSELVIIDSAVEGASALASAAQAEGKAVLLLDATRDGIAQIAAAAGNYSNLSTIHLISHASSGRLALGTAFLDQSTLAARSAELAALGRALSTDGDILLYGCNTAADGSGRELVSQLALATGADVAASDDITGASGDVDLEYRAGVVEADTLAVMRDYLGDLNLDGVKAGATELGTGAAELGSYVDGDGPWVVSGGGNTTLASAVPDVYVWFVNGATRTEYTISRPDTTNWSTFFGQGVAVDADTNTIVIADPGAGTYGRLAIYQFVAATNLWTLRNTITITGTDQRIGPWNGGYGKDYIVMDGKHILVGNPQEGTNSGGVHWFADTSAAGNWTSFNSGFFNEPESLRTDSPERFGASVAIAKDYFIVGAPSADTTGDDSGGWWSSDPNYNNRGRVYVYSWAEASTAAPTRYTNGSWSYLSGQDDMNGLNGGQSLEDQFFGAALAMEYYNNVYTIVAGGPGDGGGLGKVYIYQSTSADIGTLQAAVGIYGQATADDRAGSAVDVSQGRILVGAYNHTTTAETAVWYYEAPNNNWSVLGGDTNSPTSKGILEYKFSASYLGHGSGTDYMGASVALSQGNIAVIGAPRFSSGAAGQPGGVDFVFIRTPVAVNDTFTFNEDANTTTYATIDILKLAAAAGTAGKDILGSETLSTVIGASTFVVRNITVNGFGDAYWDGANLRYRQGEASTGISNYNYLGDGQSATVTIGYELAGNDFTSRATVTVTITGVNDAPTYVAGSIPNLSGNRRIDTDGNGTFESNGGTVGNFTGGPTPSYQVIYGSFVDLDQDATISYSLDLGATSDAIESMITVSSTGLVTWNLTTGVTQNTVYNVGIRATDNKGGFGVGTIQFTVLRDDVRPEKTASAATTVTWTEDAASTQSMVSWFTDDDFSNGNGADEALTYSISYTGPGSGTGWLSVRSDTGLLQGTPSNDNVGTTTVTVTVRDKYGQQVSHTFNLVVTNVNDAPILQGSIEPVLADQGVAFSYQIPGFNTSASRDDDLFRDIDNPANTITFTAELVNASGTVLRTLGASPVAGVGGWLTFSGGSIDSSGTVTGAGTFGGTSNDPIGTLLYVRVRATDNGSPAGISTYTFTIQTFAPTISLDPAATGITSAAGSAGSELGTAVAISRDGLYMAIGSPNAAERGGVSLYSWSGTAWTAMSFTLPGAVALGDRFGQSVALDYNGDRLLVGAPGTSSGAGTVYSFTRSGTTWTLATTYTESANRFAGDGFGSSLAFYTDVNATNDGQSFIVGAPFDSDGGLLASGKAFLYGWGNTTAIATITPAADTASGETTTTYDLFGYSLAYDGNIAVIGSPYDTINGVFMAGSVTVLGINTPGTVTPALASGVRSKISLGSSAAIGDMFGMSVDLELFDGLGNAANILDSALLAVGAPGRDVRADDHGAVYLYDADALVASGNRASTLAAGTRTELTAFDGREFQYYGWSVALAVQGDVEVNSPNSSASTRLLVGSQQTAERTGAVYMYKYTTDWNGQRYVPTGTGSNTGSMFGRAVDMSSTTSPRWVTGAPYSGTVTSYNGRFYAAAVTASASPLSLDGGSDTLDTGLDTGDTTLVPMSLESDSGVAEDSSLQSMEMTSSSSDSATTSSTDGGGTTTGSMTPTTDSTTTSTASDTETYSDLLLMDLMTEDPLVVEEEAGTLAMRQAPAPQDRVAQGLSQQVQVLQARREMGAQALLARLEGLVA